MAEYSFEGRDAVKTKAWLRSIASLVISTHIEERRKAPAGAFPVLAPSKAGRLRAQWGLMEPCVNSLSPRQRQVVRLRFREGMCYADIASRLRIPVGTVRSRLARARIAIDTLTRGSIGPVDVNPGERFARGLPATLNGDSVRLHQGSGM